MQGSGVRERSAAAARRYDVIVVGLGAMGSAAAYQLAKRGRRVLGLERFDPHHDRGSSHGESRIIRQAYLEGAFYVPLLLRAYKLWDELQQETGESVFDITGGLFIGDRHSRVVADTLEAGEAYGLEVELLEHAELARAYPVFRPDSEHVAVFEPLTGSVNPERALAGFNAGASQCGAVLRFSEAVDRIEPRVSGNGVVVETAVGAYAADALVLSAGPWSGPLLEDLGLPLPLTVERLVLHWFDPGSNAEAFDPERCPVNVWEVDDGVIFYGFPLLADGRGVKYAFHNRQKTPCDPDDVDREVKGHEPAEIARLLDRFVPSVGKPVAAKTCLYTSTPDGNFVIGLHPAYPQIAIAAGFSGHGFKFASVIGEILADLALDRRTVHDLSRFGPTRFMNHTD